MKPLSDASRWSIVLMLMVYAGLAHFNRVSISVAGAEVFIGDGGLSETQMGWVYTAFLIVYTIGMVPGGWLIDRIGSARALTLLGLTMGSFVALTGTLGWLAHTPTQLWIGLLLIRGVAGLWNAPLHPGAAHVVSDVMPAARRATGNGMVTAGALIGIAFAYPVFGLLIDRLGWPTAFIAAGATLVAYGAAWHLLTARLRTAEPRPSGAVDSENSPPRSTARVPADWSLLARRDLWLIALSYAAYGYFQYLFFYWMDYYLKDVLEVPKLSARNDTFWIMLAQGAGMALGGFGTDGVCRRLGTVLGRRAIVMTGMGVGALGALAAVSVEGEQSVVLALAVSMGALGICEGVFWTTATDIGGRNRGLAGAFMNACGNVGGLISPTLTPILAKSLGWGGAITVACAIVALGGLAWCWITPPTQAAPTTDS